MGEVCDGLTQPGCCLSTEPDSHPTSHWHNMLFGGGSQFHREPKGGGVYRVVSRWSRGRSQGALGQELYRQRCPGLGCHLPTPFYGGREERVEPHRIGPMEKRRAGWRDGRRTQLNWASWGGGAPIPPSWTVSNFPAELLLQPLQPQPDLGLGSWQ